MKLRKTIKSPLFIFFTICFLFPGFAQGAAYYISNNGDDSASGISKSTAWQTLSKVNESTTTGDTVYFRRGEVFRGEITVRGADMSFGAYGTGNAPIISGSVEITNWSVFSGNIFSADVADDIHHLFVDGELMTIARYPDSGWLQVGSSANKSTITDPDLATYGKPNGYFNGATVRLRTFSWLFEVRTVSNYASNGTITLDSPATQTMADFIQPGWGYYIDNLLGELDTPGEWYYDPVNSKVYLYAPIGVDPNTLLVEGSAFIRGIAMTWLKTNTFIENLAFYHQVEDGININQCNNVTIQNNHFRYCGNAGIHMNWNSTGQSYHDNTFDDMLNYAIKWNAGIDSGGSVIEGNIITDTAVIPGYGGSGVAQSIAIRTSGTGLLMRYNIIENTGYVGILLEGGSHILEYNVIKRSLLTLDDGGAILVNSNNNTIQSNYLAESFGNRGVSSGTHNGRSFRQMGMGLFFQPQTTGNVLENNTIASNTDLGIYPDRASNTIIKNNVAYNNECQLYLRGSAGDVSGNNYMNTIRDNIFYSLSPDQTCMRVDAAYNFGTFNNTYFNNPYSEIVIQEDNSVAGIPFYALSHWKTVYPLRDPGAGTSHVAFEEYAVSNPGTNRISNSNFSAGVLDWSGSNATIAHNASKPGMDGGSMQITCLSGTGRVYPNSYSLVQGQYYELKFSAVADDPGNVRVLFYDESPPAAWIELMDRYFSLDTSRKDHSFVFQSPVTTSVSRPFFITKGGLPANYWLDNVTIKPVTVTLNDPKAHSVLFINTERTAQTFDLGGKKYMNLNNQEVTGSITLNSFESKIMTAVPSKPGLAHAIAALQISAGISVSGYSQSDMDFNTDMSIGIEDAIIVLQKLAGVRD